MTQENNNLFTPRFYTESAAFNSETSGVENSNVHQGINITLPDFWDSEPELWFKSAENLFALKNITSAKDKYLLTFNALKLNNLRRLQHRLPVVETESDYNTLKKALIDAYTPSRNQKLNELLFDLTLSLIHI